MMKDETIRESLDKLIAAQGNIFENGRAGFRLIGQRI